MKADMDDMKKNMASKGSNTEENVAVAVFN